MKTMKLKLTASMLTLFALSFLVSVAEAQSLHHAAKRGDLTSVSRFLKQGGNPDVKDGDGVTALMYASELGHAKIVEALLKHGANPNIQDSGYGMTALMVAAAEGHTEVVRLLLYAKADVNMKDNNLGATTLLGAAEYGHTEIIKALIANGADVNARSKLNRTALMVSAVNGHTSTVEALLSAGVDVNVKDLKYGANALMGAATNGHIDIVKALIEKGAKVNEKNNNGMTALEMAKTRGQKKVVPILEKAISQEGAQIPKIKLADKRYIDPKGYFMVVPPAEWRIQEYPDDVRGKVAFLAPNGNIGLRVLVNAVDFGTIDELLEFCRSTEKRLGVTMKIEKFDFYGRQAVRRSFEIRGQRFLYVDFLIGKVDHNLAYGAPPSRYDLYLPVVLKSMETYEPILKEVGDKESLDHLVAKKLRLGRLMLEAGRADLALEYTREGLAIAPDNQELLKLKQEVDSQFKTLDEQGTVAGGKLFESKKFGFSFNVPENVNVYTANNPGPMAARIKADTPMWIVSSMFPTERINVKISEGATMNDLKQVLDIRAFSGLPQYERISVKEIKIGKKQNKPAYEHVHLLKLNQPKKLRQILFVHKGNAFGFTCSTSVDRYETANMEFFDVVFKSLGFK